ncbi:MAG: hypothetical protein J5795_00840 [Lachnospiraceae bacterium]|nr:hypothetical protein [Lachnospiraceae bacterium]
MNRKKVTILFCCILSALGLFLLFVGFSEARRAVESDLMYTHMILTIPGFLAIGSGLLCFTRKNHRSAAGFVIANFFYTLLGGFLIECIYFQFIYLGLKNPQPRLTIPVALTCLVYSVVFMILQIIFCIVYGRKKN